MSNTPMLELVPVRLVSALLFAALTSLGPAASAADRLATIAPFGLVLTPLPQAI
jgi:hypothetical protein